MPADRVGLTKRNLKSSLGLAPPNKGELRQRKLTHDVCKIGINNQGFWAMNRDQMKGNWKQLVGKAKEKWG